MRIGITTSVIQRGKTGVAQYLFALLRAMAPQCAPHQLVLFVLAEDVPLLQGIADNVEVVSVSERFRPPVKNILWHQLELPRLVRENRIDLLHIPSYRRMLWPKPCPLVATIHDLAPFRVPKKYDWKRMLYGRVVVRRLAHRQDQVIAVSENTASDIIRFFGVPKSRIIVVHNGVDHRRFCPEAPNASTANNRLQIGTERPFFLYVARLEHPGKNHVRLIEAFERFKARTGSDWLLVLGGSDWHGAEVIHQAIRRSPVAADIKALGFVADAALPDLYRTAGAFVYPSLYEGFGMPPIEAMACGCPVICSTAGSLGEVAGSAAAIVDPYDTESIAAQLCAVACDLPRREQLREAGLLRAQSFDWHRAAKQTLAVYERAAGLAKAHEGFIDAPQAAV